VRINARLAIIIVVPVFLDALLERLETAQVISSNSKWIIPAPHFQIETGWKN